MIYYKHAAFERHLRIFLPRRGHRLVQLISGILIVGGIIWSAVRHGFRPPPPRPADAALRRKRKPEGIVR
jgi:hypothetical protein